MANITQVRPGKITEVKECAAFAPGVLASTDQIQNCLDGWPKRPQIWRNDTWDQELGDL